MSSSVESRLATPSSIRQNIRRAVQARDVKAALSLCQAMLKLPAANVRDCMDMANLGEQFSDAKTSVLAVRAAHERAPDDLPLLFELINVERLCGYTEDAFSHLELARSKCKTSGDFNELGKLYSHLEDVDRALSASQTACDMASSNLAALVNLATAHSYKGQMAKAEELYDEAIRRGNHDAFTYLNRSWLRKQSNDRNHIVELDQVIKSMPSTDPTAPFLLYTLSKELEDLGRNDEAFDALEMAASARRKQIEFSLSQTASEFEDIAKTCSADVILSENGDSDSKEPTFIVGLPRSGSTLVERIIGNHGDVFAAGELDSLSHMIRLKSAELARASGVLNTDPLRTLMHGDLSDFANAYISSTRPRTGHTAHFIDKQPTNFMFCAVIAKAFPNAKIVHTYRNPMDACFAVYKQPFRDGYLYSYDQRELAGYYLAYRKLMDHWESVMPGRIIHVCYDDLVADAEPLVRDLMISLELDWQDACLDFTKNSQASMTASSAQVRQPIYKTSVQKWRQVGDRLTVLRQALEKGGIEIE